MTSITDHTKTLIPNIWHKIQKTGFWWLIIFMLGAGIGFKAAGYLYTIKFDDAIQLGGIIHKTMVYDIRLRP